MALINSFTKSSVCAISKCYDSVLGLLWMSQIFSSSLFVHAGSSIIEFNEGNPKVVEKIYGLLLL